jgi:hypothetical protein
MLLEEFFRQHVDEKLAPKTIERYHEQAAYLDRDLLNMPIAEITPLHLSREWNRLLESGGHHRSTPGRRAHFQLRRSEYRRRHLQRVWSCYPMGIDLRQSGNQQRAPSCEEALRDRTTAAQQT